MPFFDRIDNFAGDAAAAAAQAAAYLPGPASTGALRIEPDQVDDAIEVFEDAVEKLERRVRLAKEGIRANPMAADQVSQPAAEAFNHAALVPIVVWRRAVAELESIIRQLQASKEENVRTDDTVARTFSSATGAVG